MRRTAILAASFVATIGGCREPQPELPGNPPNVTPPPKSSATTTGATTTQDPPPPKPTKTADIRVENMECIEHFSLDCAPDEKCNPPAPKRIECPAAQVTKDSQGKCWFEAAYDCPPQAKCNPPAPQQVKCPKGK